MNGKILSIIAVAMAVIAGSVAAIVVTTKRADIARAKVQLAASKEDAAREARKAKEKEADAEKSRLAVVEREKEAKAEQVKLTKAEADKNAEAAKLADEERKLAEAKADEAEELHGKAVAERETAQLRLKLADATNKTLNATIRIAEARVRAEEAKLQTEKLKNEREVALIKAKDLKRIKFEEWEQQLVEWKQNLEERERAIAPEKTIADLAWVADGVDSVLDDKGNVVRQPKKKYLAENDRTLSVPTRELARAMRLREEADAARATTARDAIVAALEKLFEASLKADRPTDAEYYLKSIKVMYPDWKSTKSVTNVLAEVEGAAQNGGK